MLSFPWREAGITETTPTGRVDCPWQFLGHSQYLDAWHWAMHKSLEDWLRETHSFLCPAWASLRPQCRLLNGRGRDIQCHTILLQSCWAARNNQHGGIPLKKDVALLLLLLLRLTTIVWATLSQVVMLLLAILIAVCVSFFSPFSASSSDAGPLRHFRLPIVIFSVTTTFFQEVK